MQVQGPCAACYIAAAKTNPRSRMTKPGFWSGPAIIMLVLSILNMKIEYINTKQKKPTWQGYKKDMQH